MHTHNKLASQAATAKVIYTMLLNIGMRPKLTEVRSQLSRVEACQQRFDSIDPDWFRGLAGGEFDFRQEFSRGAKSKLPLAVLKDVKALAEQEYTHGQRRFLGLEPGNPTDQIEIAVLGLAWNIGVARRLGIDFGPFRFAA